MRFVLIHGGFHGAWCWSRTIPELERLGHEAIAIDLPAHGARRDERSTIADRRDAILAVLRPGDVLVGHSGGGYDITFAADAAPGLPSFMIYVAAALPIEGSLPLEASGGMPASDDSSGSEVKELMTDETGMSAFVRPNGSGRMECVDYPGTRAFFYHDVDDATARWAFEQLTPAPTEFLLETVHLPNFWAADLPRSFIRCLQDRAMPQSMAATVAHRLGVEPLTIDTSHSPFLSRPSELAELLVHATTTKPVGPLCPT
ncbi:alpha/beta fold hydrolase [Mycobacterium branderi]|uniref:Esterase n=1 Tax=Mycobacterium branderi TaxID=43348 RepID=A0A7I7WCX7_9MYCO|nr:alpha/beta fold hydrolase [Mycobacterium branderi]MCV7234610.1 alpha/beta fold hydrolase [Mycobacterium branderi]ORA33154.1 esterase [Mycobacterium branderi]BBZ15399.1 esterase [Mycobacterium branderi]